MRKLNQTRIEITPLQLIKWWIVIILLMNMTIVNPLMMVYLQVGLFTVYKQRDTGTIAVLLTMLLVGLVFGGVVFIYYVQYKKSLLLVDNKPITRPSDQKLIPPTIIKPSSEIVTPRDITSGVQQSFLKPGVVGEDILVGSKSAKLYNLDDIILFRPKASNHTALVGQTGSGKSVSSFSILQMINKTFRYPMAVVLDAGQMDFESAIAGDTQQIIEAFNMMYYIVKGRQKEPIGTNFKPIFLILEEAESLFRTVNTTFPKKQQTDFLMKLANMVNMSRKLNIAFIFIAQTAKAQDFPTEVRGQCSTRIFMRLNNTAARMYNIGYDVSSLPPGVGFVEQIDAFVKFPFIEKQPPLNALTWDQLKAYSDGYKRKHNLNLDVTD